LIAIAILPSVVAGAEGAESPKLAARGRAYSIVAPNSRYVLCYFKIGRGLGAVQGSFLWAIGGFAAASLGIAQDAAAAA
jgi:hypothetical protein